MNKEQLTVVYGTKILGIRNYKSDKKEFFVVDLIEPKMLAEFIVEVLTGESDITPAGKNFLDKYYGFKELAVALHENPKFSKTHGHVPTVELQGWLEGLVPMETSRFIEEAKGTIKEGAVLREDLLPPEEK